MGLVHKASEVEEFQLYKDFWHAVKEFIVDPLDQVGVLPSSPAASAKGGNALGIPGGSPEPELLTPNARNKIDLELKTRKLEAGSYYSRRPLRVTGTGPWRLSIQLFTE